MKRLLPFLVLFSTFILPYPAHCHKPQEKWQDISYGIDEVDLTTVAVSQKDPDILYAGSIKSIFKSPDGGKTWKKLYLVRGTQTAVNIICIKAKNPDIVYAGTQNGLFKSIDAGDGWSRIFEGVSPQEKDIRHMAIDLVDENRIYMGTSNGLFISNDAGVTWNRPSSEISNKAVNFIAQDFIDPHILYAAVMTGVYKSTDNGLSWERVFTAAAQSEESETEEDTGDTDTDETAAYSNRTPNCIAINSRDSDKICIGTNAGVFISENAAEGWEKLTTSGLTNNKITSLIFSSDGSLYAATQKGIFRNAKPYNQWEESYIGLASKDARFLAYNKDRNFILAATQKGIYKNRIKNAGAGIIAHPESEISLDDPHVKKLLAKFEGEPTIQEVQRVAITYAEVHKEKIDEWRAAAKQKAILPTLSVNTGRYLTDYYHWDSGTNPDTFQKGKDTLDWDVTVSWDLGNLIWNDDQTSIDTRSRLMVQLRDDVLNEVTRLYFERRRLQVELISSPPKEAKTKLEKILRLQELTAGIDALTGGYLSKRTGEAVLGNY